MLAKVLTKLIWFILISLIVSFATQAQSRHVIVILNDKISYVGELIEMTPDSVIIIDEDSGDSLVINGLDISSVYIKETDETVEYPMTKESIYNKAEKINPKSSSVPAGYVPPPPKEKTNYGNDYTYEENPEGIRFSFGFGIGGVSSITKEALKGFEDTEFSGGAAYNGYLSLLFSDDFSVGLLVQNMSMDLEENGVGFGTLKVTPIIALIQWFTVPAYSGLGSHFGIGGGINITDFETGGFVTELEQLYGNDVKINVNTDNSFVFEVSAGLDYYFIPNLAIMVEGRLLIGNIDTTWLVTDGTTSTPIQDFDKFYFSNFQYSAGLRAWF